MSNVKQTLYSTVFQSVAIVGVAIFSWWYLQRLKKQKALKALELKEIADSYKPKKWGLCNKRWWVLTENDTIIQGENRRGCCLGLVFIELAENENKEQDKGFNSGIHWVSIKALNKPDCCHSVGITSLKKDEYDDHYEWDDESNKMLTADGASFYLFPKKSSKEWQKNETYSLKLDCNNWTITCYKNGTFYARKDITPNLSYYFFGRFCVDLLTTKMQIIDSKQIIFNDDEKEMIQSDDNEIKQNTEKENEENKIIKHDDLKFDVYPSKFDEFNIITENEKVIDKKGKAKRLKGFVGCSAAKGWNKGIHEFSVQCIEPGIDAIGIITDIEQCKILNTEIVKVDFPEAIFCWLSASGTIRRFKNDHWTTSFTSVWKKNDIIKMVVDCDKWKFTFYRNGERVNYNDMEKDRTYYPVVVVQESFFPTKYKLL